MVYQKMMWCYMKYLKGIIQVLGIKKYDDILICKKDFIADIETLYHNGWEVIDITWWKHKLIKDNGTDDNAGGGVRDDGNSEYYWAETIYFKSFNTGETIDNIINYYNMCTNDCLFYDLIPAISIRHQKKHLN